MLFVCALALAPPARALGSRLEDAVQEQLANAGADVRRAYGALSRLVGPGVEGCLVPPDRTKLQRAYLAVPVALAEPALPRR